MAFVLGRAIETRFRVLERFFYLILCFIDWDIYRQGKSSYEKYGGADWRFVCPYTDPVCRKIWKSGYYSSRTKKIKTF
jgi:hypothetical protein